MILADRHGVLMVFYDLPTNTSKERIAYAQFRKLLIQSGFIMMQKSVYVKLMRNVSSAEKEIQHIKLRTPDLGTIHLITLSLNEFRSFITLQGDPFDMALFADDMVWV